MSLRKNKILFFASKKCDTKKIKKEENLLRDLTVKIIVFQMISNT